MKTQNVRRIIRRLGREDGQGMTEYIIIVALIAIAAIGVVTVFGSDIRELFSTSTKAMISDSSAGTVDGTAAKVKKNKGMGTFGTHGATGD